MILRALVLRLDRSACKNKMLLIKLAVTRELLPVDVIPSILSRQLVILGI
jgi:hypothetical protein